MFFRLKDVGRFHYALNNYQRCGTYTDKKQYRKNYCSILQRFLESLSPKTYPDTRLSFLIQGGFPEASQSKCCERFLKTIPKKLGCEYGGTFIRGDMFGIGLLGNKKIGVWLAGFCFTLL